ncbi:MAG: nitroreductase family protein [Odoribacter splanchnicus]|nr:nitroreductase family protein [Odoribacter splanchnicus]
MERNLKEALKHRRSYYAIGSKSLISDAEIEEIIDFAALHTPSAFNSQSARFVLLLGEHHKKLWEIVKETLKKVVAAPAFVTTEAKINKSFASGYGTVLFFNDRIVVEGLQKAYPLYHDKFPEWAMQSAGMQQLAVWTMLEDAGFGASLQHYNPLIDEVVAKEWKLPDSWELLAQMPFGIPSEPPAKKEFKPLEDRVKVFK